MSILLYLLKKLHYGKYCYKMIHFHLFSKQCYFYSIHFILNSKQERVKYLIHFHYNRLFFFFLIMFLQIQILIFLIKYYYNKIYIFLILFFFLILYFYNIYKLINKNEIEGLILSFMIAYRSEIQN